MKGTVHAAGRVGLGLLAWAVAATGCGDSTSSADRPASTSAPASTSTTTPPTSTTATATPTTSPTAGPTAGPTSTPPGTAPTTSQLGPQWVQADGRVLIEAVAADDAQQLLADLVALGLTDGVVVGRVVNGWLPVEAFDHAQHLASLKFLQPTGAGTGAGG